VKLKGKVPLSFLELRGLGIEQENNEIKKKDEGT